MKKQSLYNKATALRAAFAVAAVSLCATSARAADCYIYPYLIVNRP